MRIVLKYWCSCTFATIAVISAGLFASTDVQASLIGDIVTKTESTQGFGENFGDDGSAEVVDPGVEFGDFLSSLDLTANSIIWSNNRRGFWGGDDFREEPIDGFIMLWELSSLDWVGAVGEIVGIEVTSDFTFTDSTADDWFRFDAHSVAFGFPTDLPAATVEYANPGTTTIVLETRHSSSVPEPTTLLLLGLGLAGLGFRRRNIH